MKRKIIIASLVTMIAGMGYLGINFSNSHFNLSDQQFSNVEALSMGEENDVQCKWSRKIDEYNCTYHVCTKSGTGDLCDCGDETTD